MFPVTPNTNSVMQMIGGFVGQQPKVKKDVSMTFYMWRKNNQYKNKQDYTNAFLKDESHSLYDEDDIDQEGDQTQSYMYHSVTDQLDAIDKELTLETCLQNDHTSIQNDDEKLPSIIQDNTIMPLIS